MHFHTTDPVGDLDYFNGCAESRIHFDGIDSLLADNRIDTKQPAQLKLAGDAVDYCLGLSLKRVRQLQWTDGTTVGEWLRMAPGGTDQLCGGANKLSYAVRGTANEADRATVNSFLIETNAGSSARVVGFLRQSVGWLRFRVDRSPRKWKRQ